MSEEKEVHCDKHGTYNTSYSPCPECENETLKQQIDKLTAERDDYKANFLRTSQDLQTERTRLKGLQDAVESVLERRYNQSLSDDEYEASGLDNLKEALSKSRGEA